MFKKIILSVSFGMIAYVLPVSVDAATFALSPTSGSASVNSTFTVTVVLNTTGQATYGADLNYIRFNPALLQVVDSDAVASGVQIAPGSLMSVTTTNSVDNTLGRIQFSQLASPGTTYNGSGTFATITFRAVAAGTASVTTDFTLNSSTDSNIAGLGSDLLTAVTNGSYTASIADTTAPVISGGAPSGALVYTTTSTTLRVTTNENATCKVSTTANQGYTSVNMVAMSSTGGTTHTTTLSGLAMGTSYLRYVRCADTANNQNTSDYTISFSVGSAPDTTAPVISSISASGISNSGATINWTTNELSDTQVEYGLTTTYNALTALNTAMLTSHSATLTGLLGNTLYNYRVKSKDASGNTGTSANQTFTTTAGADATAPSVPTGLVATATVAGQISLSWLASTDTPTNGQSASGVAGYRIYRNGSVVGTASTLSFVDTNLSASTAYTYAIASYDVAGNQSVVSSSVSATTLALAKQSVTFSVTGLQGRSVPASYPLTVKVLDTTGSTVYSTQTLLPNGSNLYTITFGANDPQSVTLRIKSPLYLSRRSTAVNTTVPGQTISFAPLLVGDFNGDDIINSLDFSLMNNNWNTNNANFDINLDRVVNSLDFAFMSNNWVLVGQ
jgi:hypothetical protein